MIYLVVTVSQPSLRLRFELPFPQGPSAAPASGARICNPQRLAGPESARACLIHAVPACLRAPHRQAVLRIANPRSRPASLAAPIPLSGIGVQVKSPFAQPPSAARHFSAFS